MPRASNPNPIGQAGAAVGSSFFPGCFSASDPSAGPVEPFSFSVVLVALSASCYASAANPFAFS